MCIENIVIEELSPDFLFSHNTFKVLWPLSNRDFVFVSAVNHKPDGEIVILSTSVVHPAVPERSDPVRGEILNGVF